MLEMKLVIHGSIQKAVFCGAILDFIDHSNIQVVGSVEHLPNGTIKIIAQGDIETLKEFRRFVVNGKHKSMIRDTEEVFSNISERTYTDFSIK